jgi:hypothetical protein
MRRWLADSPMSPAALAPLALGGLFGLPAAAHADYAPALAPGSSYRLVFVTSDGYAATSTSDGTYNTDVTNEALLNSSLPSTTWSAIASAGGTSASSNTSCNAACEAAPIYDLDGTEIASSWANMFSGSLLNGIAVDETGTQTQFGYVWTGSNSNGTGAHQATLGTNNPVYGALGDSGGDWLNFDTEGNSNLLSLYGLSGVLTIPGGGPVPEPATLGLLASGGLAAGVLRRLRRRRKTAG